MTTRSIIFAALALLGLTGAPALAQTANKTWVSSTSGSDTGTCQFVAPCKTFAYAITQTAPGGELDVKDAGSYGVVTINKAISIVGAGTLAAIAVPSGAVGVTISAGSSDKVVLQGLVIDGHGVGSDGIDFNSGMSLSIVDCHVRNVTGVGISLQPTGSQLFYVTGTEVSNADRDGIIVQPYSTLATGSLSRLDIHDNKNGIFVGASSVALIDSTVSGNEVGIRTATGADILIGNTTVTANTTYGIQIVGGESTSYGDNYINNNATDVYGTLSTVARR